MNKASISNKIFPLAILAISIIFCFSYVYYTKPKYGYIILQDVFNEFKLKKELQKKLEQVKSFRQKEIDSLKIDLTILSKKIQTNVASKDEKDLFERKRIEFNQKMQIFEEDNAAMTKQYDNEIITQLNQYIKDYGTKNNYDMILGNNSDGSLMYGKEAFNITKDVTAFINEKYEGKK